MTLPMAVSSAGESPNSQAPHHVLCAGVIIDGKTLKLLSDIQLEETSETGIVLPVLAQSARDFIAKVAETLDTPAAVERALQLYLEQRLSGFGLRHSQVVVKGLVRE